MKAIFWMTCLLSTLLPYLAMADDAAGWEEIYVEDGVRVWRKEIKDSPFYAFRGEGDIDAPISKVAAVLRDVDRAIEWLDHASEVKRIREINPFERVEYYHVAMPFIVKDRDFLYRTKVEVDKTAKTMTLYTRSVDDPDGPKTSYVRGEILLTKLVLTVIDGGKRTHAIGEAHADPKGSLPAWVVNMFQKKWPYNTFINVRKQLLKPDIAEDPLAKELLM